MQEISFSWRIEISDDDNKEPQVSENRECLSVDLSEPDIFASNDFSYAAEVPVKSQKATSSETFIDSEYMNHDFERETLENGRQ